MFLIALSSPKLDVIYIKSFITWVCKKFSVQSEDEIIHHFRKDTGINLDLDKQLNVKQAEKEEFELEM